MKTTHDLHQGTQAWHDFRANHFGASEASAMLGLSPYKTRSELLREKATGITPEVDERKQKLFDRGHETEASARLVLEEMIGEGLSPVTMSNGKLSASLDGLTFGGDIAFEHKLLNEALFAAVLEGDLPEAYQPQCQQVLMVSGAEKVIFVCSDGTAEKFAHVEVFPDAKWQERIRAGWAQFEADLATYQHVEPAPVAVAAPIKDLPAIVVEVSGELAVTTNFQVWGEQLRDFIARIPAKPSTDQEFADCKAAVAAFKKAEDALEAEEKRVLGSVPSIDDMKREKQVLFDLSRSTRLALEKLVAARDITLKQEIVQEGKDAAKVHTDALNQRLGKPYMPVVPCDFATAIKGKRSYTSMREAVGNELVRFKLEASAIADKLQANMTKLQALAADYPMLLRHEATLIVKAPDDMEAQVKSWIADHKEAERVRLEAEREKIRAEEAAKAQAKADADTQAALKTQRDDITAKQAAMDAENARIRAQLDATKIAPAFTPVAQSNLSAVNTAAILNNISPTPPITSPMTGSARLMDRLDDLARQLTERELSDLCIHAQHIISNRSKQAA